MTPKEIINYLESNGIETLPISKDQLLLLYALMEDVQKELEK